MILLSKIIRVKTFLTLPVPILGKPNSWDSSKGLHKTFWSLWTLRHQNLFNPSASCIWKSYIKIRINLNFHFRSSLWWPKKFFEGLYGLHKRFWGTTRKSTNKRRIKKNVFGRPQKANLLFQNYYFCQL